MPLTPNVSPVHGSQIQHDLDLPALQWGAEAEAHALQMLRLYKSYTWLAAGADPKDRGPGDELVSLAASTLMSSRHLDPSRPAILRRMLQVPHPLREQCAAARHDCLFP